MQQMRALRILLVVLLYPAAKQDLKEHRVQIVAVLPAVLVRFLMTAIQGEWKIYAEDFAGTLLLMVLLYLFFRLSKGGFGEGDLWILAGICLTVGPVEGSLLLMLALLLASGVSAVLLLRHRIGLKEKIPFVPFLWISILCFCIGIRA